MAALTMPGLIVNYQKKQFVSRLQQTYSMLNQAVKLAEAENGDIASWDWSLNNALMFEKYIAPHLKIIRTASIADLKQNAQFLEMDNAVTGLNIFRNASGMTYALTNGVTIFMAREPNARELGFGVDVDGIKKVNSLGKDIFYFVVTNKGRVIPLGAATEEECAHEICLGSNYSREDIINGTANVSAPGASSESHYRYGCNKTGGRGAWCAALIMYDGWEIRDDYPW